MEINMSQYWLMMPSADWEDWERDGIISSKWNAFGDYRQYSKEQLDNKLKDIHCRKFSDRADQIIDFSKTMQIDDYIFVKKSNRIIAYGKVVSDYKYDPERQNKKQIRKVQWIKRGVWDVNGKIPRKDLINITDNPILKAIKDAVLRGDGQLSDVKKGEI